MNVAILPPSSERLWPSASGGPLAHRPGGPVYDGSTYAAVTADGRTLSVRYLPAGAAFPIAGEHGVRYVRVGLPQTISH